ncbi:isochorismatase family cysteine hydrolase [Texcoconibacillus texcoconensis]|uniref:Nicotinamidase-related amidase n=1 Tax=Texcoconibacillus texcoconensis TaxID=1095777 RepID=A0A840QNA2_9BACI|nr:nicotinamidase-related amidase [Texcoconibacillus texcoconensis]
MSLNKDEPNLPNDIDKSALIFIDVINDFNFADGYELLQHAIPMAERLAKFKKIAKEQNIPVIYVNDHYGNWRYDFRTLVNHCMRNESLGKEVVQQLLPEHGDYHILKPQYSGFFYTPLDLLLDNLNVNKLILTGVSGNMCVQFTANDAYMRGYHLHTPSDAIASRHVEENNKALHLMEKVLKADISPLFYNTE